MQNKTKKEAIYKDSREPLKQLSELFSVSAFLDDLGMTKIGSFGYKFSETTMFSHFIEKRCKEPHNPYYLFFDEYFCWYLGASRGNGRRRKHHAC